MTLELVKTHEELHLNMVDSEKKALGKTGATQYVPIRKRKTRHKGGMQGKLLQSRLNLFKVTLPCGNKYDKEFVLRTLLDSVAPMPFTPFVWKTSGASATFYVDEYKLADKLLSLDRQIQCPDGFQMPILVKRISRTPDVHINATMKEKLQLTIAKRYNVANKALDLTKFYADPDLQDLFCGLFNMTVFRPVIEVIFEDIPEIESLNLHDNRIYMLDIFRKLDKKLPCLKILHLGNNNIRDINMLDPLRKLQIVDLVLEGNPLCDKFKEQSDYISEIWKRFPKVIKLDGIDLRPTIGFDIGEEVTFPPSQQIFLCNVKGHGIVCQVLEKYFQIFDSESRQPLLQVYHENVMFSMTSAYSYVQNPNNANWLDWYSTDSRNLLHDKNGDQHMKFRQGRLSVVSFVSQMPVTKHDIHSFTVDLSLFTPQMLVLTVTGIFKELARSGPISPPIRFFCRTLVIVPVGSDFCIANEQLHVTNATKEQAKHAFKTPVFKSEAAPTPAVVSPIAVPVSIPTMSDDNIKQQMIQTMSQESGMNLEWSQKCLELTNWDFDRAESVFIELQKQGTIPAAAFV